MGVCIPNMEMPEHCGVCRFAVDGWCYAYGKPNIDSLANDGRTNFCPLVSAADVWPNKTNGDMIRRMDNNNLAEWISSKYCPPGQKKQLFRQAWLDWLNKEVGK